MSNLCVVHSEETVFDVFDLVESLVAPTDLEEIFTLYQEVTFSRIM